MFDFDLILASNSPRRRTLLALTGWTFRVQPAEIDETPAPGEHPADYVRRLAEEKALAGARRAAPGSVIIGSDTTVADGLDVLGKPADPAEAIAMLRRLRARSHRVYTAVAVCRAGDAQPLSAVCAVSVPMRAYTDEEIETYVASGDPLDKAGAYAIQHAGFHPVETLSGCYAAVMGLPLCHLTRLFRQLGLNPPADVPAACQQDLSYACPVSEIILRGGEPALDDEGEKRFA